MQARIKIFSAFFFLKFLFSNWEKEKGKTGVTITKQYVIWVWASCGQYNSPHYAHAHLNPLSLMLKYFPCTIFIT